MEKIIVELEAKTDKALKGIDSVAKSVEDLNKEVVSSNKDTAKSLKNVESASGQVAKGVKGIGNALKAAGIGLAIAALTTLKEVFMQNQKAADFFNTSFEVVSIAFNDFVNFIIDNGTKVTDFFKAIFEDPLGSVKELGASIKANIIERFESFLDTLGFLASAVKKVFSGDFAGALEDVKSAGKESLDVLTGVNDVFDKSTDFIKKSADAISDYTNKVIKGAKENVELAKSAELASAQQGLLIEKYDIQAERLRQIRDDDRNSLEERRKANNDLLQVLDKQEKSMIKLADIQIASAQADLDKNNSIENQVALIEALSNKQGVLAQIEGFRSEQKSNDLALSLEQNEIEKEAEETRLDQLQERADREIEIEQSIADRKKQINLEYINFAASLSGLLQQIAGKNKAIAMAGLILEKGAAIANVVVKAKESIAAATANEAKVPFFTSVGAFTVPNPLKAPSLATTAKQIAMTKVGAGLAIAGITATAIGQGKSISGGGGGQVSTPTPSVPIGASTPPAFNVVGQSGTNQLAEAIGGQSQQPVQAYVVANDVTTAQSMDRNIIDDASLGD